MLGESIRKAFGDRARRKRFASFREFIRDLPKPVRILDVGGREQFWITVGCTDPHEVQVTLLNLETGSATLEGFSHVAGNACALSWATGSFDVVFSNSVIEHVGGPQQRAAMAREVMRVGRRWFIQTPNRWFPIEPHFLFPCFQFLPLELRARLASWMPLCCAGRIRDLTEARRAVAEVELIGSSEMRRLFPGSQVLKERAFGLTKSLTALGPLRKPTIGAPAEP